MCWSGVKLAVTISSKDWNTLSTVSISFKDREGTAVLNEAFIGTVSNNQMSQWSQTYFVNDTSRNDIVVADLTPEQHEINNEWFKSMLSMLKDDGVLYVPVLDKEFNKKGEEIC